MYLTVLYSGTYLLCCQTGVCEFPKEYLLSMFEEMVIKREFAVKRGRRDTYKTSKTEMLILFHICMFVWRRLGFVNQLSYFRGSTVSVLLQMPTSY